MVLNDNRSFTSFLRRNGVGLLCTVGVFILYYQVAYSFRVNMDCADDYRPHMLWALEMTPEDMLSSFYDGSNKLWHIFARAIYALFLPNLWKAAAAATAAADAAAYLILFKIWDRALPEKPPRWLLAPIIATLFIAEALMLPGGAFYRGDGKLLSALNTWHNPTNIMVRPFALAAFYMTVNIYHRRRTGRACILPGPDDPGFAFEGGFWRQFRVPVFTRAELVFYPLCLLLSAWAKPSFLQFFGPAIFLFLLIDVLRTKGMLLPFCIKMAAAYVPASYILYQQFFRNFSGFIPTSQTVEAVGSSIVGGPHGVQIYVGQAASAASSAAAGAAEPSALSAALSDLGAALTQFGSDWLPLVLFCAFPLFILVISPRKSSAGAVTRLGLLCAVAGRLEAVAIHETGSRASHGNFLWGWSLSAWVFWAAAIGQYALLLPEKSVRGKLARYGGTALLAWHLAAGAAYIVRIFQTYDYLF